mgnify:CR=1 FL=1
MLTFVLMTKLRSEIVGDSRGRRAAGKAWLGKVKKACPEVRFLQHYAILGPYDFMDIYEAPDVETAHRVSLISRAEGAVEVESWQAMPYEKFLGMLAQLDDVMS